jgi:hypothetical protein
MRVSPLLHHGYHSMASNPSWQMGGKSLQFPRRRKRFSQSPLPPPARWGVRILNTHPYILRTHPYVIALPSSQLSYDLCVLQWLPRLRVILVVNDQLVSINNPIPHNPMCCNQRSWSSVYGTCRSKSLV